MLSDKEEHRTMNGETRASIVVDPAFLHLIPAIKPFEESWLASLVEKGAPRIYRSGDLRYIAMPVSGICTGQVYLSGDGRLCHWDVFKAYGGRADSGDPRGPHYAHPQEPDQPFSHGFAIRCGNEAVRPLSQSGFAKIEFEGTYPIGRVRYRDPNCGVAVALEAFSPFIPLNEDDSGMPLVLLFYTLQNATNDPVEVAIGGWIDNPVCPFLPAPQGRRIVTKVVREGLAGLEFTASLDPGQSAEGNGSMTLALLGNECDVQLTPNVTVPPGHSIADSVLSTNKFEGNAHVGAFDVPMIGGVGSRCILKPAEARTVVFAIAWHFPVYSGGKVFFSTMENIPGLTKKRRYYSRRFNDSKSVVEYAADNIGRLAGLTRLWNETWYDSTLPRWFLDRTFLNTSILATQTCHRFDDGRFYGWEGVDSCPGTCQHVWQYAQALAHVFPALERHTREFVDYGIAYHSDGSMDYRAEGSTHGEQMIAPMEDPGEATLAADGMLGTIIRVYREHKMSADSSFLRRLWPRVRQSIAFMMTMDRDADGLLEGPQYNTLDATWYGRIPSISSLFLGALAVGRAMALEMQDEEFAGVCERRLDAGKRNFVAKLFNGEYFVHEPDPTKPDTLSLGDGCYIDQVLGQSFGHQIGFERIIPADKCRSALHAIWKYNFTPDAGWYRREFQGIKGGRWYAMDGEAGIIMCTWPLLANNRDPIKHTDMGLGVTAEGYLNECMNGFEYQVAAHMIAEGMVEEGLAITRAIDDRYGAAKRNPWNEVECGDHYSRSMASFGVFLTACGLDYHGPAETISFDPKLSPVDFRCAVILAEGWGSFAQRVSGSRFEATLTIRHGRLALRTLSVRPPEFVGARNIKVRLSGAFPSFTTVWVKDKVNITLSEPVVLSATELPEIFVEVSDAPTQD
jgi:uncharacterized protein (DUF608 family)